MHYCVEIYWLCCLSIESPSCAHISTSYRFHKFSLNVLFTLKHYKKNFGNSTTVDIFLKYEFSNLPAMG